MKLKGILMLALASAGALVASLAQAEVVAEVDWHDGEMPPSETWIIEPVDPNIHEIVSFSGPGELFSNACYAEMRMMGIVTIAVHSRSRTVELWFEPPGPWGCPGIYDPVCGLEGRFGPLTEGDWVFFCDGQGPYQPDFTIAFHVHAVKLVHPNAGEALPQGSAYTIEWADFRGDGNCPASYLLDYSSDTGANWIPVEQNAVSNTCSYEWVVPAIDSNQCLFRVTDANDPNVSDTSDAAFTIYECTLPAFADPSGDCLVNMADLVIWTAYWLQCGNPYDPTCLQ